jgi:thiamine monophosphate kinase
MLDTSDGLAEGAWLLSGASHVRVVLEADRLPWDRTLGAPDATNPEWRRDAFYGGDYELLAAVPRADAKVAARWATRIGRIEPGRGAYLELEGQRVRLPRAGWDPFAAGAEERRRRSRRGAKH